MILRRITEHVKAQNWFAVAIDFVIVVAGILIAFQITDWSDRRAERGREARYLAEIAEDLRADLEEIDFIRGSAERRMAAVEAIFAKAGVPPPRREFSTLNGQMRLDKVAPFRSDDPYAANATLSGVPTLDGARHTYEALVNTGEFRILRDRAVARAIEAYYADVDEMRAFEADLDDVRRSVSAERRRLGVSNMGAISLDALAAIVATDKALAAELETYWGFSGVHVLYATALRDEASALIERIEKSR